VQDVATPLAHALLFASGFVAGVVNVVAGGGSFLTLPILMFLGLPAAVANGTNRVAVLLQNAAAVWSFRRYGIGDPEALRWAVVPASIGAVGGTALALVVGDELFKRILAILMIALTLWTLWSRPEPRAGAAPARGSRRRIVLVAAFLAIGVYGGFVQAGVGFLVLAGTSAVGLDLVRGNAVKVLAIFSLTAVSLVIFAWSGRIDWPSGLVMAAGTILGALLGARLTVRKGHRWVRGAVTVTVVVFALKLWFWP
jgi:uncharacterized membrane protein YfcA